MEGFRVEIARALVEQAGDHVADAGFAGRILRGAAAEGIFHRDQGHRGVLHEPGFDAARRHEALNFCCGLRWRRCDPQQRYARDQAECEALRADPKIVHERFSSRFGAASLIR